MASDESEPKEDISGVLFSLASSDRLTLLNEISTRKQRQVTLSKSINASAQECSRHLTRLADSGFVRRDSKGFYEMTSLGRALVGLFPTIRFLIAHRPYFLAHDLGFLPKGFLERTGELSTGEYVNHFSLVLELIKEVISSGQDHVWLISDQPMVVGPSIGPTFFSRDVPVRLIGEPTINRKVVAETKSSLPHSEIATLPEVRIAMAMNENIAGVCFSGLDGKIDFGRGFAGTDLQFRTWCSDLFEYYWAKGRKI